MTNKAKGDTPCIAHSQGAATPLSYNAYLKVEELKQLQICQSNPAHHDEPLFIIIHQAYELWFKLILHELDTVFEMLGKDNVRRAQFYMKRIVAIMRLLVQQIHILETMTPKDFLGFRYNLNPASGFQSAQFREIEFACGLKDERMLEHFSSDKDAYDNLKRRYESQSLPVAFYDVLRRKGFILPEDSSESNDEVRQQNQEKRIKELLKIYNDPEGQGELYDLAESFVDLDELIALWRTHHVQVVERMIGFKRGTGGSEGVGYLRSTLSKRCFDDLWNLRTYLEQ